MRSWKDGLRSSVIEIHRVMPPPCRTRHLTTAPPGDGALCPLHGGSAVCGDGDRTYSQPTTQRNELTILKFNPQIDVGSLVTASAVMCSLGVWFVTAYTRDQQSVKDLAAVQSTVSNQIADVPSVIAAGMQ